MRNPTTGTRCPTLYMHSHRDMAGHTNAFDSWATVSELVAYMQLKSANSRDVPKRAILYVNYFVSERNNDILASIIAQLLTSRSFPVSVTRLSCFVDSLGPILLLTCYHGWRFCRTDIVEDHKRLQFEWR